MAGASDVGTIFVSSFIPIFKYWFVTFPVNTKMPIITAKNQSWGQEQVHDFVFIAIVV